MIKCKYVAWVCAALLATTPVTSTAQMGGTVAPKYPTARGASTYKPPAAVPYTPRSYTATPVTVEPSREDGPSPVERLSALERQLSNNLRDLAHMSARIDALTANTALADVASAAHADIQRVRVEQSELRMKLDSAVRAATVLRAYCNELSGEISDGRSTAESLVHDSAAESKRYTNRLCIASVVVSLLLVFSIFGLSMVVRAGTIQRQRPDTTTFEDILRQAQDLKESAKHTAKSNSQGSENGRNK